MSRLPSMQYIGVQTYSFEDASRSRPVIVELWYPTAESGPIDEPTDFFWIHPKEVRNGVISKHIQKYPLIMMSHGHGGDRRDRSWLADFLVKNGFIVASVEHHGNSRNSYNPLLSLQFWERAKDISFAITELLQNPKLKDRVHADQIGFVGYSLGGMTGLSLGGAIAQNVKQVAQLQQQNFPEMNLSLIEKMDFSIAQSDFFDPRIKAMVLLSPATFVFPPESLKAVKVPVALIASEGDEVLPFNEHALQVIKHLVPTKLKLLKKHVSHYVFLNPVSNAGKTILKEELRCSQIEADRVKVHAEVGSYTVKFFRQFFKT